ncbi:unnamed protein product [Chondrus crispus]|uniref:Uncharacterized protein n=1 Tax=Chondrus crispus TaxID=2769 RepID=R7QNY4_CHOCR|nr:unnamed protein product [Chondrus crispus]CDF39090.1 unnamed protein product [Chondrus crispus]|eukprot:XP_005719001.1 unnamed protein product [Chondrus crispus]
MNRCPLPPLLHSSVTARAKERMPSPSISSPLYAAAAFRTTSNLPRALYEAGYGGSNQTNSSLCTTLYMPA